MSYYELWNVLSQWKGKFTVKEFVSTFFSPDASKVLHDMAKKGFLQKAGWGRYKVVPQEEYVRAKFDVARAYNLVKQANLPYAFSGPDAVFIWTKGGYNADRFFGFYPISMNVKIEDFDKWKNFFSSAGQKFVVEGRNPRETLFGVFYWLRPVEKLQKAEVEGYAVEPLKDAVIFCEKSVYTYEPALEMLDEMYNLGLGVKYRESSA